MEIIRHDKEFVTFEDQFDTLCEMRKSANALLLQGNHGDIDLKFSQEDIKALLPYLQSFAETGQLEPQSPLQGVDEAKLELEKAKKGEAYYRRQCDQQVDRIADLEELIEEWRDYIMTAITDGTDALNELQAKTSKLLGEDHD